MMQLENSYIGPSFDHSLAFVAGFHWNSTKMIIRSHTLTSFRVPGDKRL